MKNNEVEIQKNNKQIHFLNEQLETLYETNNAAIDAGANFGFYNYQAIFKNYKNIRGNITDALDICKNNNLKIETKEIIKCFSDISDRMNFMEDDYIEDVFPESHLDVSDMCFPDISKFVSKCLEKYDEKSVLVLDSYSCISIEQNHSENIEVNCVPYNEFGKEIARYINAEIVELDNEGHIIFQGVESEQLSFFDSTPSITKYSIIISEKIQSALNADNIIALSRNLCDDGKMMFVTDYLLPYNQQTNDEVLTLNKAGIYVEAIIDLDYSWLYTFKKYRNRLYIFTKRNSSEVILGKADISELDDFSELMFCGESDETEFVRVNDKEAVCYHDYIFKQLLNKAAKEYNGKIMYLKETEADFRKSRNNNTNTLYFSLAEGNSCMHTFPDTERVYQHLTTIKLNEDVLLSRVASNFYNSYLGKKIVREYCIEHFGICWPRKYKHILELPVVVYDIKKQLEYVRTEEKNEIIVKNMVDVLNKNFIELKNKCDSHEEFFEKLDSIYGQKSINNILSVEHKEAENEIIEIMHDFEKICEIPNDSLLNKLDIEEQENVKNYLITSNVVYHFLESRYDCEELDFSAALISLTKSLELVMNVIYKKMNVYEDSRFDIKVLQNYINRNGSRKSEITLGPAIYLLKDGNNVRVNNYNFAMNWDRRYNVSHFTAWNDNTISISELRRFNDIEVRIDSHSPHDSRNQKISVSFSDRDDSYNRMLLVKGLEYIKDHHRNIVAHKESVSKTVCDECREMLLQAEHLLWILLYIMND